MAEDTKFVKGMNKDTGLMDQIDSTYRDAINALMDINKGSISNEFGTTLEVLLSVPSQKGKFEPVGVIAIPNDNFVIFTVNLIMGASCIFYVDANLHTSKAILLTTTTSVKGHLNFSKEYPVTGEYRVSPTGETIVYFTDNKFTLSKNPQTNIEYISEYNPPRILNVTRQLNLVKTTGVYTDLYQVGANANSIRMLNLFMDSGRIPEFDSVKVLQGGGIESGTYFLGVAYADKDFTETNVLGLSNPVYIVPSPESYIPREIISGSPNEFQTNKSILWKLTSVNTDYKYVVPYVLQRVGEAEFVYKLEPLEIGSTNPAVPTELSIVYSGLENAAQSSVEAAVIDKVRYLTAKSLTQLDNKLYAANLTARKDLGYQRFANSIVLTAKVATIGKDASGNGAFDPRFYDAFNLNSGYAALYHANLTSSDTDLQYILQYVTPVQSKGNKGYRDVETNLFKKKTYRRGEVYAFYISFVLEDGSETYAYHIPGRNVIPTGGPVWKPEWERETLYMNVPTDFNPDEITARDPNARVYQYLDTSIATGSTMGYWENQNELYPNTDDFDIWETDSVGTPVQVGTLRGKNVRHHKMPSNHNVLYSHVIPNTDYSTPNVTISGNSVVFEESVRILGVALSNIRIPKFILQQIQGYKVYYAKRTQANKTIIGQSGLHPASLFLAANLSLKRSDAAFGPYHNLYYMVGTHTTDSVYSPFTPWSGYKDQMLQSVFKFHDFNLLRKKHTLATATHIDLQYVVTMQLWRGGFRGATNYNTDSGFYEGFRAGNGDDEHAWIHPDLGNTINFEEDSTSDNYDVRGVDGLNGSLLIAAAYHEVGRTGIDVGYSEGGHKGTQENLGTYQSVFAIDPDSATYLAGLTFFKNASATGFKGATYLINNSGESAIALGLTSGIPPLAGYKASDWIRADGGTSLNRVIGGVPYGVSVYVDSIGIGAKLTAMTNYQTTGGKTPFFLAVENQLIALGYNGAGNPGVNNGDITLQVLQDGDVGNCNVFGLGCSFTWSGTMYKPAGAPNTYLANLCSAKTDVFEPFDQQSLVSTGYYKSTLDVNLTTGLSSDGRSNYYTGASSDTFFGGDTYLCRYGYRSTSQSFAFTYLKSGSNQQVSILPYLLTGTLGTIYGDIPFEISTGYTANNVIMSGNEQERKDTINNENNWQRGSTAIISSVYQYIVESDDNINFRHAGDVEKGVGIVDSVYFDKYTAADIIYKSPLHDLSKMDNLLYEDQYSALQDKRVSIPYPKKEKSTNLYPNRVIRSLVQDGNFNDTYRYFTALEYRDFGQNKGAITNIFNLESLLYIHTEKSLFRTKGKQTMELGDTTQAYIGSGDLFAQEPDEFVQSSEGYLGLQNRMTSLVTKDGYFFLARDSRKMFMVGQQVTDLSAVGLSTWSRENIPFEIENMGVSLEAQGINLDAPTGRFGFTSTYDPALKRIIVTKRELVPTDTFLLLIARGDVTVTPQGFYYYKDPKRVITIEEGVWFKRSGWTISLSLDFGVWASRHSYIPPLYAFNTKHFYSFDPSNSQNFYAHDNYNNPCTFYGNIYNFEFEYIYTGETTSSTTGAVSSTKTLNKIFGAISYVIDTFKRDPGNSLRNINQFHTGFTSFYVYNTSQHSGIKDIKYLSNIRKVDNSWFTNDFRDMSGTILNTSMQQGQVNVQDDYYNGTVVPVTDRPMFLSEGVVNPYYISSLKPWHEQRKFVDKFLAVRLISNNQAQNLINLYTAKATYRASNR